jgi:small subunit ribosomal protein S16
MIKVKLAQLGKKRARVFRIFVAEAKGKRNGKIVETLGTYDPTTEPETLKINQPRLNYWLKQGAQLTNRVRKLVRL